MKKRSNRGSLIFAIIMLVFFFATIFGVKRWMERKDKEIEEMQQPGLDEIAVAVKLLEEMETESEPEKETKPEPEPPKPPEPEQPKPEVKPEPPKPEPPKPEPPKPEPPKPKPEPPKPEVKPEPPKPKPEPPKPEPPKPEPPKPEPPKPEPPKPEPPKPEPPKPEPPKPEPKIEVKQDEAPVADGNEVDDDNNDEGSFPVLSCSSRLLSFKQYAREMEKRGSVFFHLNKAKNHWEKFSPTNGGAPTRFEVKKIGTAYSQPNKVTGEDFSPYIKVTSDTEVFLAKTMDTEKAWRARITHALKAKGIKASQLSAMRANYRLQGTTLYMDIYSITYRKNGETKKVSISVELPPP